MNPKYPAANFLARLIAKGESPFMTHVVINLVLLTAMMLEGPYHLIHKLS